MISLIWLVYLKSNFMVCQVVQSSDNSCSAVSVSTQNIQNTTAKTNSIIIIIIMNKLYY